MEEIIKIQSELKAPKNLRNSFGGYNYRSCESILESVKPLLKEYGCYLCLSDAMVAVGDRVYVEAVATLTNKEGKSISVKAYAREEETKKGMDAAQITGAASSYARKYALNGLFAIDDTKDPDTDEHYRKTHAEEPRKSVQAPAPQPKSKNRLTNAHLDNPIQSDCMLDWGYQKWAASGYSSTFDVGAALLASYDADDDVVLRFTKLFESYRSARKAPK